MSGDLTIRDASVSNEHVLSDLGIDSVALVHDYLNQRGGAERVVLELSEMWPQAPIYTSLYRSDSTLPEFRERDVRTSALNRLPVDEGFRNLFPLYPLAFRSLGSLAADLVISSSSGWAHAVRTSPGTLHVVYCHTPARWLYGGEYMDNSCKQTMLAPLAPMLRAWDTKAAQRPDLYIANSKAVQSRIKKLYGREAPIVYPPVDVDRFTPMARGERLLVVSRLLPYKRVDVVVRAATKARLGLDVVGTGPALAELQRVAGPTVTFHGKVEDAAITEVMENCRALCLAGEEDFGITPVEAMAAGKPVIAFGAGGALETVEEEVTGSFFLTHEVEDVLAAIKRCDQISSSPDQIAEHARRFSSATFRENLLEVIQRTLSLVTHPSNKSKE
jgi:glycosyltransferase involved in cell wall biosynthesis